MSLGKNYSVVSMASSISNPELLRANSRTMDCKLLCLVVVGCGSFHFWGVIAVAKLSEAEASHVLETVDVLHEWQMAFGVQSHKSASEKVELHSEFS